jgi:hypothetical protein
VTISTEKIYIWCGPFATVVFLAGMAVAGLIPPPAPSQSAVDLAAFYAGHQHQIQIGLIIALFGAALWIPWLAKLAVALKDLAGPGSAVGYTQLVFGAFFAFGAFLPLILLEVAVFRADRPPAEVQAWSDGCWLVFTGFVYTFVVELLLSALTIASDPRARPTFPKWVAYFDVVLAAANVVPAFVLADQSGPFAWNGIVSYWIVIGLDVVWIAFTTVYLLRAEDRTDADSVAIVGSSPARRWVFRHEVAEVCWTDTRCHRASVAVARLLGHESAATTLNH